MSKIFICYSRHDSGFVDRLVVELQKKGFEFYLDREKIQVGAAWTAEISRSIRACKAFLLILSPQSVQSDDVRRELEIADNNRKFIIPIRYQPCDIPPQMQYQLAGLQIMDVSGADFTDRLALAINNPPDPPSGIYEVKERQPKSKRERPKQPQGLFGTTRSVTKSSRNQIPLVLAIGIAVGIGLCMCTLLLWLSSL